MLEELHHALTHSLTHSLKIFPLLFLTYLLMEYLEHHTASGFHKLLASSRSKGPLFGALLGLIPQCGFSGAAAGLYVGGAISVGTLLAVFLATSDEMLPVLISAQFPVWKMLLILGLKFLCGCLVGFLVDFVFRKKDLGKDSHIQAFCEQENCSCQGGIFRSALLHTLKIFLVIFVVLLVLELAFHFLPESAVADIFSLPFLGEFLSSVLGLLPNCAVSVMLTNLFTEGMIGPGPLFAGLLSNAGVGLLVLLRTNRNRKENLLVVAVLVIAGTLLGVVLGTLFSGIL